MVTTFVSFTKVVPIIDALQTALSGVHRRTMKQVAPKHKNVGYTYKIMNKDGHLQTVHVDAAQVQLRGSSHGRHLVGFSKGKNMLDDQDSQTYKDLIGNYQRLQKENILATYHEETFLPEEVFTSHRDDNEISSNNALLSDIISTLIIGFAAAVLAFVILMYAMDLHLQRDGSEKESCKEHERSISSSSASCQGSSPGGGTSNHAVDPTICRHLSN